MTEDTADHVQMLRDAGLRVTQQRRAILSMLDDGLAGDQHHPRADDLVARARSMDDTLSVATVYRTLATLEEAGLIRKITFDDAPARYEMTPQRDHDHLVDIDTGDLIEIPGHDMAKLRTKLAADLGYDIVSHHTTLHGRRKRP